MLRSLLTTTLVLAGLNSAAHAHFKLNEPASSTIQDALGDPQKTAPCGGGTASGAVTNYLPGSTITLKLAETISHPGHYRVALAQDMASLPADPPVTPGGTACGSAPIAATPVFPVIADGLFLDLTPAMGEQMVQVQLPAGMTCNNCVLQVLEFMSNHAAPCFYYHCATVNISATAPDAGPGAGPDAGPGAGPDAGMGGDGGGATGGCSIGGTGIGGALSIALLGLGLVSLRRRRS